MVIIVYAIASIDSFTTCLDAVIASIGAFSTQRSVGNVLINAFTPVVET
jgi:hypothetical protein